MTKMPPVTPSHLRRLATLEWHLRLIDAGGLAKDERALLTRLVRLSDPEGFVSVDLDALSTVLSLGRDIAIVANSLVDLGILHFDLDLRVWRLMIAEATA